MTNKILLKKRLFFPLAVVVLFSLICCFLFPNFYPERILPVVFSLVFLLWLYDKKKSNQPWLLTIVSKYRKNLDSIQIRKIGRMELTWEVSLVINLVVLFLFLYFGSYANWILFASVGFYCLLGCLIFITIVYVEGISNILSFLKDNSLKTIFIVIHIFNFSVFGIMCILFIPSVFVLKLVFIRNKTMYHQTIRIICYHEFRFVFWLARISRFFEIHVEDLSCGIKNKLLICNHICMFDIVILFCIFPQVITFVNEKFLKNPLIRPIMLACGYIPISKNNLISKIDAFEAALSVIKRGAQFAIYPEGTRSKTGRLGELHRGAFHMAIKNQINITPVFHTMDQSFLNNIRFFNGQQRTVHLKVCIMPEIDVSKYDNSKKGIAELMEDYKRIYLKFMSSDKALSWTKLSPTSLPEISI